jgi:arsenite transporter
MHNHSTNLFAEEEMPAEETSETTTTRTVRESLVKKLSFLDRFLALWIFLAMVLGILLGCFVPRTQDVLNTAKLIGVSAPIGTFHP